MKLLIILSTLLASLSSFAAEDKFMVLRHRTDDYNSAVAKVRITHEFFMKRDLHIACVFKDRKIFFYIAQSQISGIHNSQNNEAVFARWVFDFSDLDQVSARLADGPNVFDMESDYLYRLTAVSNGLPVISQVAEIPISQPSNLQFVNDYACIIRKTPSSNN